MRKRTAGLLACALVPAALGCDSPSAMEQLRARVDKAAKSEPVDKALADVTDVLYADSQRKCEYHTTSLSAGEYAFQAVCTDQGSRTYYKNSKELQSYTSELLAKGLWRLFRALRARGLVQVTVSLHATVMTAQGERTLELMRASLNFHQLETVAGWDTIDPYKSRSPNLDVLVGEQWDFLVKLSKVWRVEVDNRKDVVVR